MKLRAVLTSMIVSAAAAVPLVAMAPAASAAPIWCLSSDADIYRKPLLITGKAGDLLGCREVTLPGIDGNIPMKAWKIKYVSTDVKGAKIAVSGTVAIPTAAWSGGGSRPVVAFNPGTLGSGPQCAFSKQMAGQYQDAYEGNNVGRFLKAGMAVAATDGVGYMDGQVHTYMIGNNAGHALLNAVRAARQIPGGSLKADGKVGISGYSEGGAASLWAAQLAASYAPELNVVGAAAGGVPGDLKITAKALNGGLFAGFLADALVGLNAAYPEMPFNELMNDKGREAVANVKRHCLVGTLATFLGARVEDYTTKGYTLDGLYALKSPAGTSWGEVVDAQKLGVNIGTPGSAAKYKIGFPVFQYRGALEEIIPIETEEATRAAYCTAGINTKWKGDYIGEHLTADWSAADDVTAWLNDRFQGRPATGNC